MTLPTRNNFTGQYSYVADDATDLGNSGFGLMFYNARWYDPGISQFTSPDTLIPNPSNTLDWNRYSYARYNPLRYTDPSGHSAVPDFINGFINEAGRTVLWWHPGAQEVFAIQRDESNAMLAGRLVADVASIVVGAVATGTGTGAAVTGAAACAATAGGGCVLGGAAVIAGGVVLAGQGVGMIGRGLEGIYESTSHLNITGNGDSSESGLLSGIFKKNSVNVGDHFYDRLSDWNINENDAYKAYLNGKHYTDDQGRLIIWDPKSQIAFGIDPDDFHINTVFKRPRPSNTWLPGWAISE